MLEETQDDGVIIERVAAVDVGKAEVVCCVRVPSPGRAGRRSQEVRTYTTMTRSLAAMGDWLRGLGVSRVVMEATSDYWKPPFYLLEAAGFETWLVNAKDVKHLPGRPKTDPLTELRHVAAGQRLIHAPHCTGPTVSEPHHGGFEGPDLDPVATGSRHSTHTACPPSRPGCSSVLPLTGTRHLRWPLTCPFGSCAVARAVVRRRQAGLGVVVQGRRAADAAAQFRAARADPRAAGSDQVPGRPGRERGREKNRVEKLLEDAGIKLSVVASDIFGVSGRDMMAALIGGERDPLVLAQMARTAMRAKIPELREAFTGHFSEHHAFLLSRMLAHIDAIDADIRAVEDRIQELIVPFADAAARLDAIPGVGPVAAQIIIAEIGVDMTRFPTPAHLASWARFAPGVKESAGRTKGNASTGHGNRYLARALGEAAVGASRTDTFLGERYRRIARRRGKKKAIVAVGRSILVIVWHLLSDPEADFIDLGPDHYDQRRGTQRAIRGHIRQLQALGYRVTLQPVA
jgi:transposase